MGIESRLSTSVKKRRFWLKTPTLVDLLPFPVDVDQPLVGEDQGPFRFSAHPERGLDSLAGPRPPIDHGLLLRQHDLWNRVVLSQIKAT
jgi:hypothetical protein